MGLTRGRRRVSGQPRDGRYCRARYYHPGFARFISENPTGFVGGDVNLYAYVRNDPVRFVDPSGNALSIIAGIAGGALAGGAAGGLVGGISGFLTSVIEGQDLTQAIQSGIVSAGSGALAGAIVGGTVGGLAGGGFVIGVIVGQSANIGLPTVAGSIAGTIAGGIASVLGPPVSPAEGSRGSLGGQGLALELRLELVPQAKDIGGLSGGEKALRTQVTHNRGPGEPADLQKDTGAALRFPTSFGGLSKADLSAWLGLAISLFLGWIIVMPFVAAGPFAHPLVIGGTGVAFSAITTTLMMRAFRSKTDADESASIAVLSERATFAYPLVLRRLLRFGRIFWPLMLAVSVTGVLGGLDDHLRLLLSAESLCSGPPRGRDSCIGPWARCSNGFRPLDRYRLA